MGSTIVKFAIAAYRLAVAGLITAAIVGQLMYSLAYWNGLEYSNVDFQLVNFFSFFTIDSNIVAAVTLFLGAFLVLRGGADPRWFAVLRASATTYMVITGIVYNLLLRAIELPQGTTLAWSNEVLHAIGPALVLLDWLLVSGKRRLRMTDVWIVLAFPIVWTTFTMLRGPWAYDVENDRLWYPYPFPNPETSPNGYLSVSLYMVIIALMFAAVAALVIWGNRRRTAKDEAATDAPAEVAAP